MYPTVKAMLCVRPFLYDGIAPIIISSIEVSLPQEELLVILADKFVILSQQFVYQVPCCIFRVALEEVCVHAQSMQIELVSEATKESHIPYDHLMIGLQASHLRACLAAEQTYPAPGSLNHNDPEKAAAWIAAERTKSAFASAISYFTEQQSKPA